MQGSSATTQTDSGLPDSSHVVTEEPLAPQAEARLPDEPSAPPEATPPAQDGPPDKGEAPAKPPESDASARRNDPAKRIGKLTRQLRDAERDAAYLRGKLEATEQARGRAEPVNGADPEAPKLDDYDSAHDFAEALADYYAANPGKRPAREPRQQPASREPAAPQADQREPAPKAGGPSDVQVKSYVAAKAQFPDLDDVLFDSELPWTKAMADAVAEDEDSAEILYHLGQDEDELERISKLPPKQQEREVWRFADKYRAGKPASDSPAKPDTGADNTDAEPRTTEQPRARVTRAAPIPPPLSGASSATKDPVSLAQSGDQEAYEAEMNRRDKARRR